MSRLRTRIRSGLALIAIGLFGSSLAVTGIGSASAAGSTATAVSDASFAWGLSGEQGGGSFFGGCNFLSAGIAGNSGSSRLWTEADGFYATRSGNVTVEKPNAAGGYAQPSWATKCTDSNGAAVSAASPAALTKNRVLFTGGTGSVDPASNTASLHWSGSFTSVFYGGMTYWSASSPSLTVQADGTATLTATASGYGADMNDASKWISLPPRTVTLANLGGVTVSATGFTVTPDYLGVATSVASGTPQAAKSGTNASYWGAFPQSFIDFQQLTGQSSYWFASGGARDSAKPAAPLTVAYSTATPTPTVTPSTTPTVTPSTTPTVTPSTTSHHPTVNLADSSVAQPNSCQLTAGIKGGSLVWGFKKSFRSYVASPAGNSITASGGARILAQELALPVKPMSGTYLWPFVSSSAYASPSSFTIQYGGAIELKYPAHYFDIVIAKPRLVVSGNAGTMYADVRLTVSSPTAAPVVDSRTGVPLASLNLSGAATSTASGITRVMHTAIQDTRAFTFDGSAFYQKGAQLDDATVLLSGCAGAGNSGPGTNGGTTGTTDNGAGAGTGDSSLVPDVAFRPGAGAGAEALPYTGINLGDLLATAGLAVAGGLLLIVAGTRRRYHLAGEHQ